MPIRLRHIHCRIVEHPLRPDRIVVSPAGRHDRSEFLVVSVEDDQGLHGFGEAATTALWSGETAPTARAMIENLFAPLLLGHGFDHPREALARMDRAAFVNGFAKSAVDTAMWDLWARQQGRPAVALFGDRPAVASIPSRASVGCYGVDQTLSIATAFWDAGIRTLKFKVGSPGFDDVARLRAVRDRLGAAPILTVDANGGYADDDTAVAAIEALLPFNLALVEQPTPRDRIGLLAKVRRRVQVPILADEAIFTPAHLEEALDLDAFDYLSIYPGKNGGFTHALDMAQRAARAGKPCTIGNNGETDLGQAALAVLAAGLRAFPVEELACDLAGALYYERSSVDHPLPLTNGRLVVPTGPGFGVEPLP